MNEQPDGSDRHLVRELDEHYLAVVVIGFHAAAVNLYGEISALRFRAVVNAYIAPVVLVVKVVARARRSLHAVHTAVHDDVGLFVLARERRPRELTEHLHADRPHILVKLGVALDYALFDGGHVKLFGGGGARHCFYLGAP